MRTLDAQYVPTPLLATAEQAPVVIAANGLQPRHPTLALLRAFGRYFAQRTWLRLTRRFDADADARRLRETFEALGGLWIKVGQLLSLRTDVFSEPVCRELGRLQYRALGFPFAEAKVAIEAALGRPLERVFDRFEEAPIAAASVSQVHRAVLRENGVTVVVKVLRPNADEVFRRDLRNFGRFISLIEAFDFAPHVHWRTALWELEQMVVEELDFRYEAANMRRMRKSLRPHNVYVARVFLEHCNNSVLVAEFLPGVLMSDFIRIGQADPERAQAWCRENRIEPRRLGKKLFETAMRQLLEDNLFHADLHPGNIMLLRDNRFALLDFGTIGSCARSFIFTYKASLAALAEKDFLRAADMTLRLAISPPGPGSLDALRTDMVRSYRLWEGRTHLHRLGYHERSLATAGSDSGRIMFKYKVQLSWEFMRISRTWGTLDASLSFLLPNANYMRLFRSYFRKSEARRMRPLTLLKGIAQGVRRTVNVVEEYQEMIGPAVRKQMILSPSLVNASERLLRFARTAVRITSNVVIFATVIGAVVLVHRFHPELALIDNKIMGELADGDVSEYEAWLFALLAGVIFAFTIRRSLKSVDSDPTS